MKKKKRGRHEPEEQIKESKGTQRRREKKKKKTKKRTCNRPPQRDGAAVRIAAIEALSCAARASVGAACRRQLSSRSIGSRSRSSQRSYEGVSAGAREAKSKETHPTRFLPEGRPAA